MKARLFPLLGFMAAVTLLIASGVRHVDARHQAALSVIPSTNYHYAPYDAIQAHFPRTEQLRNTDTTTHGVTSMSVMGPQPFVTILCRFADMTNVTPHDKSYFEGLVGSAYPGSDHYWRELSYETVNLIGSVVVGWYNLPHPRSHYAQNGELHIPNAAEDCTSVADADVHFPDFFGINLIFNSTSSAFIGQQTFYTLTRDGQAKTYGITFLEAHTSQQGLVHEMGHSFGLPHSSSIDIMNGWFGSIHPVYDQIGLHTIAPFKDLLGWIPTTKKYVAVPGTSATITLERLALPQTNNYLMAQIPISNSTPLFYTVEARHFAGYDQELDGAPGVLIHRVDLTLLNDLNNTVAEIVPSNGGRWESGETFTDSENGITVSVDSMTATGFRVTITTPKANQAISFTPLPNKTVLDPPFTVTATASSGLSISFSATGTCTVNGTTVTLTGLGSCTITAHQAGTTNYNPAPDIAQTFMITKASQIISFAPLADRTLKDSAFTVTATASSALPISFSAIGACTVNGSLVTLTGLGSCTIAAHQSGNADYTPAPDVVQSFMIYAKVYLPFVSR